MNCEREFDVFDAVMSGRWPDGCDDELRSHAQECAVCVDLVGVAHALRSEYLAEVQDADVPPSGVVWWKAQRRARRDAVASAQRTITAVQTGTIAAAVIIGLAIIGGLGTVVAKTTNIFANFDFTAIRNVAPTTPVLVFLGLVSLILLAAPVAVWFAVHED
jgi:hypothetical protein